jgi:hypothetical protein
MTTYYIKLDDAYLQINNLDTPFFSTDKVGRPYTTTSTERAKQMLSVLFKGIPYELFTLEEVATKYQRRMYVGYDILVWCNDNQWHNKEDLPQLKCKPTLYDTIDDANMNIVSLGNAGKPYVSVVLG